MVGCAYTVDVDDEGGEEIAHEIDESGGQAISQPADVSIAMNVKSLAGDNI